MTKRRYRWVWIVAGVLLIVLGALALSLTPPGLRIWAKGLERALARELNAPVAIERLTLGWPPEGRIGLIRVGGEPHEYVVVEEARVRVSLRKLLRGIVWLDEVHAERVSYGGWPDSNETVPENTPIAVRAGEWTVPAWPAGWERLVIPSLRVETVRLVDEDGDRSHAFRLIASLTEGAGGVGRVGTLRVEERAGSQEEAWPSAIDCSITLTPSGKDRRRVDAEWAGYGWGRWIDSWPTHMHDRLDGALSAEWVASERLSLTSLTVISPDFSLHAVGQLAGAQRELEGEVALHVPDLTKGTPWSGAASATIRLDGTLQTPRARADIAAATVHLEPFDISELAIHARIPSLWEWHTGHLDVSGVVDELPVMVRSDYRKEDHRVSLTNVEARAMGAMVTGATRLDLSAGTADGVWQLVVDDVQELARHRGWDLGGRVSAQVVLKTRDDQQSVRLEGVADDVEGAGRHLDEVRFALWVDDVGGQPRGTGAVHFAGAQVGDVFISSMALEMSGDRRVLDLALTGQGGVEAEWSLALAGSIQEPGPSPARIEVVEGAWHHPTGTVELRDPVRITRTLDGYALAPLSAQVGEGFIEASGHIGSETLDLRASVTGLSPAWVGMPETMAASSPLTGELHVSGALTNPTAQLYLSVADVTPVTAAYWGGPPASVDVNLLLSDRRLNADVRIRELTDDPVTVMLDLPLDLSLVPFHLAWPPKGRVAGHIRAETDLGELAQFAALDVNRLSGRLSVDLRLAGRVAEPEMSGRITVEDGGYEHDRLGIVVRNIQLSLAGQGKRLSLERFQAGDGQGGTVAVSGSVGLVPEQDYPFEVSLQLDGFRVMRNETAQALAGGKLNWKGTRTESRLAGMITLGPVEFYIPERLSPALVELNVVGTNGAPVDGAGNGLIPEEVLPERHALTLDVTMDIPDRFYVRGRGLDSEWGGTLDFQGRAAEPVVVGTLRILRGRFNFFGKRLGITKGLITIDGTYPPAPVLDVAAEVRSGGITSTMRLTGPMAAPEISLASVPEMPEDEILARMLFGRDAARITPWQAVTMARAVNRLRGGGGAFDVLGDTRRWLGVDQIELRERAEDDDTGMAVSVGKYVSDRVYVELERGVAAESGRALVEVEITPTIRLESEVGTQSDAGVGMTWSWDY